MKRKRNLLIGLVVGVLLFRSFVFVDETEAVIVTQFGKPVRTLLEAGPYLKLPYQSTLRVDRRLQIYDPRPSEFLAREKKNVNLDVFVLWRVDDPNAFVEAVRDIPGAEVRLHDVVWSELAAEVGRHEREALVSTDPEIHRLDEIVDTVTQKCAAAAQEDLGIRIVGVHLKRIGLPEQVRDSVFDRMRAERSRIARQYRAEGEEQALKIQATADKERTVILAKAYADSESIRGEAEAEAIRTYAAAHGKDPELYELLRTLEAYDKFLDEKTTVFLSAGSDLLRFLTGQGSVGPSTSVDPLESSKE